MAIAAMDLAHSEMTDHRSLLHGPAAQQRKNSRIK